MGAVIELDWIPTSCRVMTTKKEAGVRGHRDPNAEQYETSSPTAVLVARQILHLRAATLHGGADGRRVAGVLAGRSFVNGPARFREVVATLAGAGEKVLAGPVGRSLPQGCGTNRQGTLRAERVAPAVVLGLQK